MAATKYLIIIAGPTAVGKTSLSIDMAKRFKAEIISADSRQYYKELSIGTAKPSIDEQGGIKHHFTDSLSIQDEYSIGQFERDVISCLDKAFEERSVMIMTGGSGMHIRAITHGLDDFPDVPKPIRESWERKYQSEGIQYLQAHLRQKDPIYAKIVDLENSRRLIRALSVMEIGNQPFSSYLNQPAKQRGFEPIYILLERDRDELYNRINQRVDLMMESGLLDEAKSVIKYRGEQALNTIGYKEMFAFFDGEMDYESAVELIKRNSRRYAKRQLTWFRKEKYWNIFPKEKLSELSTWLEDQILV